jgi:hypothetical protein
MGGEQHVPRGKMLYGVSGSEVTAGLPRRAEGMPDTGAVLDA